MALVTVEVIGKTLIMSGGIHLNIGERFGLDTDNPEHAMIIKRGWVRKCPPVSLSTAETSSLQSPPTHKAMKKRSTRRKQR
jgi:hypothetical protein